METGPTSSSTLMEEIVKVLQDRQDSTVVLLQEMSGLLTNLATMMDSVNAP